MIIVQVTLEIFRIARGLNLGSRLGILSCIWTSDCADFVWSTCLCVDEDPLAEDPFGSDLIC